MTAEKKEPKKKSTIVKLKLSPEELKKRRLENLRKANEARKAKRAAAAAAAKKEQADETEKSE